MKNEGGGASQLSAISDQWSANARSTADFHCASAGKSSALFVVGHPPAAHCDRSIDSAGRTHTVREMEIFGGRLFITGRVMKNHPVVRAAGDRVFDETTGTDRLSAIAAVVVVRLARSLALSTHPNVRLSVLRSWRHAKLPFWLKAERSCEFVFQRGPTRL